MNHLGTKMLTTERLILRRYKPEDAPALFESGMLGESLDSAVRLVEDKLARNADVQNYNWVIEYGSAAIGRIKVVEYSARDNFMQIGYSIGEQYRERGLMTEALRMVLVFLLRDVGVHRVYGQARVSNGASIRVMQKCGMVFEGRQRKHFLEPDGSYVDVDIYAIIAEDCIAEIA